MNQDIAIFEFTHGGWLFLDHAIEEFKSID